MIYLGTGFFKPMIIIISIPLLPLSIAGLIFTFKDKEIETFIISLIFLLSYIAIGIGIYKYSKSKKYYLLAEDNHITINYPNTSLVEICIRDIVMIEYYKISSFRAWCMLHNYVCPQSAFITYLYEGKEICEHIGYPELKKLRELCADIGVSLVIK